MTQTQFLHDEQHDRNPKWNTDYVIQRVARKRIGKVGFDNPTVDKIDSHAKEEKRIFEVTKAHRLMSAWDVKAADYNRNQRRPKDRCAKFDSENEKPL